MTMMVTVMIARVSAPVVVVVSVVPPLARRPAPRPPPRTVSTARDDGGPWPPPRQGDRQRALDRRRRRAAASPARPSQARVAPRPRREPPRAELPFQVVGDGFRDAREDRLEVKGVDEQLPDELSDRHGLRGRSAGARGRRDVLAVLEVPLDPPPQGPRVGDVPQVQEGDGADVGGIAVVEHPANVSLCGDELTEAVEEAEGRGGPAGAPPGHPGLDVVDVIVDLVDEGLVGIVLVVGFFRRTGGGGERARERKRTRADDNDDSRNQVDFQSLVHLDRREL